jgi:hypothetical protein
MSWCRAQIGTFDQRYKAGHGEVHNINHWSRSLGEYNWVCPALGTIPDRHSAEHSARYVEYLVRSLTYRTTSYKSEIPHRDETNNTFTLSNRSRSNLQLGSGLCVSLKDLDRPAENHNS